MEQWGKYRKRLSKKIRKIIEYTSNFHTIILKFQQKYQNNVHKIKNNDKNAKKVLHIIKKCSTIISRKRLSKPVTDMLMIKHAWRHQSRQTA